MRKVVGGLFMSLDGVVESPDQWSLPYFDDDMAAEMNSVFEKQDAILMGRKQY